MNVNNERRDFIMGVGAAAASTAMLAGTQALAQDNSQTGAKPMAYQPKPMPFDPKSITGISEKVLVSHYENNYVGAVKRLNAIGTQLSELDFTKAPNFVINGLKREELIASNSMILHEIYFDGLGGASKPSGAIADAIARDFGSVERWRAEFVAMGKAEGGGSGWVILAYSPRDKRLVNQWAADHTTTLAGGAPFWCSTCTSTLITWTTAPPRRNMSTSIWKRSSGTTR
jgi:superoxide dismutase, Fe-Mn family